MVLAAAPAVDKAASYQRESLAWAPRSMENVFHCTSLVQKIFCMTRLTGGFNRFILPILVTEFTGHFLVSIVNLVFGMHIMFEE